MKTNCRSTLLLMGLFSCSLLSTAQEETATKKAQVSQKKIDFIIDLSSNNSAAKLVKSLKEPEAILGLPEGNDFVFLKQNTDILGHTHKRYAQTFRTVPVVGGSASMNYSRESQLLSLSNEAYIIEDVNITPTIGPERARTFAYNYFDTTKLIEDDSVMAKAIGYTQKVPELKILPMYDTVNPNELVTEFKLVYEVEVFTKEPVQHSLVYVDANNGVILWNRELIFHTGEHAHSGKKEPAENPTAPVMSQRIAAIFAEGVAATRYNGNRTIETASTANGFVLRDGTRGKGINTYNSQNTNKYSKVDFVDNDNSWTAAEHDNREKDNGALDAHWGAEVTYDYWNEIHKRNSYDGRGAEINSWVHFNENSGSSTGFDNAYWNGSNMTYGDGNRFDVLTALDVVAHEIGHAVCSSTADLAYRNESGALNEGFSDIWGAAVEFYVLQTGSNKTPGKRIWDIGEDLGITLRSMSNPKSANDPDTYLGTNWKPATPAQGCSSPTRTNDRCGVHTNSGVLNHWFYILTAGKSGSNDVGDTYSVSGIGMDKAAKIAYRMESVYLTENSTFADARIAGIQSAKDLYGAGGTEEIATTNAWYAVNVGNKYSGGGGGPTVDTEAPTAPTNLVASDIKDTSAQLTWNAATDNVGVTEYQVWLGDSNLRAVTALSLAITGMVKGRTYTFRIKAVDAAGNVSNFSNSVVVTAGVSNDICEGVPQYSRFKSYRIGDRVVFEGELYENRGRNLWDKLGPCGKSSVNRFAGLQDNVAALPFDLVTSVAIYPNPVTSGLLHIAVDGTQERVSYTVNGLLGQVVKQGVMENNSISMDLSDLTSGIYIVRISIGAEHFIQKINVFN